MARQSAIVFKWAGACGLLAATALSCGKSHDTNPSSEKGGTGGSSGHAGSSGRAGSSGHAGSGGRTSTSEAGGAGESGSGAAGGTGAATSGGSAGTGGGATGGTGGTSGVAGTSGEAGQGGEAAGAGAGGESGSPNACASDGAACDGGLCSGGKCVGSVVIEGTTDLTQGPLTAGRACAESPEFAVLSLTATSATLGSAPASDCLAAGDEVLLINLQGGGGQTTNIGNWELLTIRDLSADTVSFTTPKQRTYGAGADSDDGIGSGVDDQKVALVRVPHFGALTIPAGQTLTSAAWDGSTGGVVALRAVTLDVAGTLSASSLGYRGGRWSTDSSECTENVGTEAGESIGGLGGQTTSHNAGGPGGLGAGSGLRFVDDTPICASAGHSAPGEPGINPNSRTPGEPGAAYGANDGSRLTLGSGAAGNITCSDVDTGPGLKAVNAGVAGGIVFLLVDTLTVEPAGGISATPIDASRDVSASGGYIFIRGNDLSVGDQRVTAMGGVAHSGSSPTAGQSNQSSPGYIVLQSGNAVEGTTNPAANVIP
ncbi:MAG TPA: hypothetical protein VMI54_23225 [Polyangiaceae bacterium]|nr:hypothetical protein [Polyangiaceae bacterium]